MAKEFQLTEQDMERLQSLSYLATWHHQASGIDEISKSLDVLAGIAVYLTPKENKKLKEKIAIIRTKPVDFFIQENKDALSKQEKKTIRKDLHLVNLEKIRFDALQRGYKPGKKFIRMDGNRIRLQQIITVGQVNTIVITIRSYIFNEYLQTCRLLNLEIPQLNLPQTTQHNLQNVGIEKKEKN